MPKSNPVSFSCLPSALLSLTASKVTASGGATLGEAVVMHLVCPQLLEAISQGSQSRRQRRQADRLKPYIAAQVDVLPETFTLGDEKNYKGFYNKPLSQDLSYRCFVLASLEDGDTVRSFCWGPRLAQLCGLRAGGGAESSMMELSPKRREGGCITGVSEPGCLWELT